MILVRSCEGDAMTDHTSRSTRATYATTTPTTRATRATRANRGAGLGRVRGTAGAAFLAPGVFAATLLAGCTTAGDTARPTDTVSPIATPVTPATSATSAATATRTAGPVANVVPDPQYRVSPRTLVVLSGGRQVAASCTQGICLWDTATGALARAIPGSALLAASPDGATLATQGPGPATVRVGDSYRIPVWLVTAADGATLRDLAGHTSVAVTDAPLGRNAVASFSPTGALVATAGDDTTVRVWSVADGSLKREFATAAPASALAWSPDSSRLATVGPEAPLVVWDIEAGTPAQPSSTAASQAVTAYGVAWSPDGRRLAVTTSGAQATVRILDVTSRAVVASFPWPVAGHDVAFQPGGALVAISVPQQRSVVLWDPATASSRALSGHSDLPYAVRFSPDGAALYSVSSHEGVWRWDVAAGGLSARFDLPAAR